MILWTMEAHGAHAPSHGDHSRWRQATREQLVVSCSSGEGWITVRRYSRGTVRRHERLTPSGDAEQGTGDKEDSHIRYSVWGGTNGLRLRV